LVAVAYNEKTKNGTENNEQKWARAKNKADVAYFKALFSICFEELVTVLEGLSWELSHAVTRCGCHNRNSFVLSERVQISNKERLILIIERRFKN
jgi:hypothetical protein